MRTKKNTIDFLLQTNSSPSASRASKAYPNSVAAKAIRRANSSKIVKSVVGIEISSRAVRGARQRCPGSTFWVGDINHLDLTALGASFNIIIAYEVMYYVHDIEKYLQIFGKNAEYVLLSYFDLAKYRKPLDPVVAQRELQAVEMLKWRDMAWRLVL